MHRNLALTLLFVVGTLPPLIAQNPEEPCGTDMLHQKNLENSDFRKQHEAFDQRVRAFVQQNLPLSENAVVTLPVVVHIIHQNGTENLTDAQVLLGIQQLNEAYANTGYYDQGTGTNTMIQFCLARRTPDNQPTNGITRDASPLTNLTLETEDVAMKNLNRWDPTQYVNIWLVREICSAGGGCGVAGYAYFPSAHGNSQDGIVMEARWLGSTPGNTGVLAHEMGHYLGLYHTFQGGCTNNNCLVDGDQVCDTPPDNSTQWVPCDAVVNTCSTDTQSGFATDQNDMITNFMDYTSFNCFHDFTAGQSVRMNAAIQTTRKSLLDSKGCNDPCPAPVVAAFTPGDLTIPVGQTLNFTNASQNATSYTWSIGGTPFSNAGNAAYTFATEGVFVISLTANSPNPDQCLPDEATAIVQVVCPVVADFQASNVTPAAGETVNFTNASQNATQLEWFIDGNSQGPVLTSYTFQQPGVYIVRLNAGNGLCERAKYVYISVRDSCADVTFQHTYGNGSDNRGIRTLVLSDGNFLIAGQTPGGTGNDISLIKTKPDGELIWQKRYGGSGSDDVRTMVAMPDGGWVLAGNTNSMGSTPDPLIARFAADGSVLWQKVIVTAQGPDYFTDVKRTKDGQLILAGAVRGPGIGGWGAYLAKVDPSFGNIIWARIYDDLRTDFLQCVYELADGGFAATGFTMSFGQNSSSIHDGMILRTDASGNLLWTKAYGTSENEGFTEIYETATGDLINIGASTGWNGPTGGGYYDDAWLVKTAADGTLLASFIYRSDQGVDYYPSGMVHTSDDGCIWAVNDQGTIGTDRPHYFKTDVSGALQWSRLYNGADPGRIFDADALPDGFLLTGYFEKGGVEDVVLLKTDPAGFAGQCPESTHSMTVQAVQPIVVNGQLFTRTPPALQNANLTIGTLTLSKTEHCLPDCLDEPPPLPCSSFQNTYGTPGLERGIVTVELPDGGLLIGGHSIPVGGQPDLLVVKTDAGGNIIWSNVYGSPDQLELLSDLQTRPDGSFFMSFTLGSPPDAAIALCDPNGNVLFARRIVTNQGSLTDSFYDIIATSDGGYLAAGAFSPNDNTNWSTVFLKLDANGNIQWYRGWNNNRTDFVTAVRELPGGGYIASGFGSSYGLGGPHDGIAVRLDANGNLLWTKAYGTATEGGFSNVELADDGGFLFAAGLWNFGAGVMPEGGIVRTDANGNLLWTKLYRPSNNLDWETSGLAKTPDGDFLIAGRNRPATGDTKAVFLKIDRQGELIWSRQYGGGGLDALHDVAILSSGSLLWTGVTKSYGAGNEDFYLLKTDPEGRAEPCPELPHTTAVVPVQITQTNGTLQEITPPTLQSLNLAVQPFDVLKTEICAGSCDSTEICNNGLDDDGDNLFDCLDPDCDCHTCDGQQANRWYFGRQAGLDFANGSPQVLTDGKTNTNEASAVANDPLGQLIFYTDAKTIFQRNHVAMPNGTGLSGHTSSSQTLIVPHPGDKARFYVFTPDSYDSGPVSGLTYTEVDMSLNTGLGDVPNGKKNLPLVPANELVEQLSAVRHCNGVDFWVLTHRKTSNAFLAYQIDQNGLNTTPVVSNTGSGGPAPNGNYDVIGQMKLSPDGLRLARALFHSNAVEVFDFDPGTGAVSNPMFLQASGLGNAYGVEFSPNGRYLYVTGLASPSSLFQFDLLAGDAAAVAASAYRVATHPGSYHFGQLQLAPNGKLYTTNSGPGQFTTQLGVIHQPEIAGAGCLYQEGGQTLAGTPGTNLSLPNFVTSYFWKPDIGFENQSGLDTVCQLPQDRTFRLRKLACGIQTVDWQISGAGQILSLTKETVTVRFDQPGTATLIARGGAECGESFDTLQITVLQPAGAILDLGPDRAVCNGGVSVLDAGPGFQQYRWQDGSDGQTLTAAFVPGKYWVDVWDQCGNKQSDTVEITLIPATVLDLGANPAGCAESSHSFQLPAPFQSWYWYPEDHLDCANCPTVVSTAPVNTTYIVVAVTADGCVSADTLDIQILGDTTLTALQLTPCSGQPVAYNGQNLAPGGPYPFVFQTINGCDSTVLVTVTELDSSLTQQQLTVCAGQTASYNGQNLTPGGPYPFVFTAANGCDSTVLVSVVALDTAITPLQLLTCATQPALYNGLPLPPGGPYPFVFQAANGCDSTVLVTVSELDTALTQLAFTTCAGQTVAFNGQTLLPGGPYPFAFQAANGCDSTVLVTVSELDTALTQLAFTTCAGQTVAFNGQALLPGGPYPFVFQNTNGCDSTVLVSVIDLDSVSTLLQLTACTGETAAFNGQGLAPGGPYPFVFAAGNGCDSTVLVTVTELDTAMTPVLLTVCEGETALYNGQSLLPGGPYAFALTNSNGCDSTVLVTVTALDTAFTQLNLSVCPGQKTAFNGQSLAPGGPYPFAYLTAGGCDSTVWVTVTEAPGVTVDLPQINLTDLGATLPLTPVVSGTAPLMYSWTPPDGLSCTDCAEPLASPVATMWYTLRVTDANGCTATDSVWLRVNPVCNVYLPNAFQPENDGLNSRFYPQTADCVRLVRVLRVYSRWGELVFERRDFAPNQESLGWDGRFRQRDVTPGVFTWYAEFELTNDQIQRVQGDVTVL